MKKETPFLVVRLLKHTSTTHTAEKTNLTFVLHNEWHVLAHTVAYFSFYHSQLTGQEGPIC